MPAGGRRGEGPFDRLLTADVGEIDVVSAGLLEDRVDIDGRRLEGQLLGQDADGLRQRVDADDLGLGDDRGLLCVVPKEKGDILLFRSSLMVSASSFLPRLSLGYGCRSMLQTVACRVRNSKRTGRPERLATSAFQAMGWLTRSP